MKYFASLLMFVFCSCTASFKKEGDAYLYLGKDNITVTFAQDQNVTPEKLQNTADIISLLLKDIPASLKKEKFSVEGLTDDEFYNIFAIGDALFFGGVEPYQNKMAVYAFISSIYDKHLQLKKRPSPVPLEDFSTITKGLSSDTASKMNTYIINYAVNEIFYVSLSELSERQERYFYPNKTKEELFRILLYPELLGFWNYMAQRFGKDSLFTFSQEPYSETLLENTFGESPSALEGSFVKYVKAEAEGALFPTPSSKEEYDKYLNLYMTGTKNRLLMKD